MFIRYNKIVSTTYCSKYYMVNFCIQPVPERKLSRNNFVVLSSFRKKIESLLLNIIEEYGIVSSTMSFICVPQKNSIVISGAEISRLKMLHAVVNPLFLITMIYAKHFLTITVLHVENLVHKSKLIRQQFSVALKCINLTSKFNSWAPYEMTHHNKDVRNQTCRKLLQMYRKQSLSEKANGLSLVSLPETSQKHHSLTKRFLCASGGIVAQSFTKCI